MRVSWCIITASALTLAVPLFAVEAAPRVKVELSATMFDASAEEIGRAWRDCADAVEMKGFRVDTSALETKGWRPTDFTLNGITVLRSGDITYATNPSVRALIRYRKYDCSVEALSPDPDIENKVVPIIEARVKEIAAIRKKKHSSWQKDGKQRFAVEGFNTAFVSANNKTAISAHLERDISGKHPVILLVVDTTEKHK